MTQPVLAVCGDSTFYHAAIPALINAVHQRADMTFIVLDNSGTAMTGFQSHRGLTSTPWGRPRRWSISPPSAGRWAFR